MTLPVIQNIANGNHTFWIIHNGKFANNLGYRSFLDNTASDCYVKSDFNFYKDMKSDPYWGKILTRYQNGMFVMALGFSITDPIVEMRIATDKFIDCHKLKKLCFVFNRNDNGRKVATMLRRSWINIRDERGVIQRRCKLSGLHGYHMRGRIDLPDDLHKFFIEFKLSYNCSYAPGPTILSVVTAISDMWLEERDFFTPPYTPLLNDKSDPFPDLIPIPELPPPETTVSPPTKPEPEPEPPDPDDPNPPEPSKPPVIESTPDPDPPFDPSVYAWYEKLLTKYGKYTKIQFNKDGLVIGGGHATVDDIYMDDAHTMTVRDFLNSLRGNVPDGVDPDEVVATNEHGWLIGSGVTLDDLTYRAECTELCEPAKDLPETIFAEK